jgi:hypothetical protein
MDLEDNLELWIDKSILKEKVVDYVKASRFG